MNSHDTTVMRSDSAHQQFLGTPDLETEVGLNGGAYSPQLDGNENFHAEIGTSEDDGIKPFPGLSYEDIEKNRMEDPHRNSMNTLECLSQAITEIIYPTSAQITKFSHRLGKIKDKLSKNEAKLRQKCDELEEVKNQMKIYNMEKEKKLEKYEKDLAAIKKTVNNINTNMSATKLSCQKEANENIEAAATAHRTEIKEASKKINDLEDKLKAGLSLREKVEKQLHNVRNELTSMTIELTKLRQEKQSLEAKVNDLQLEIEQRKKEEKQLKLKIRQIEAEAAKRKTENEEMKQLIECNNSNFQAQLDKIKEELGKQKDVDRTQLAYALAATQIRNAELEAQLAKQIQIKAAAETINGEHFDEGVSTNGDGFQSFTPRDDADWDANNGFDEAEDKVEEVGSEPSCSDSEILLTPLSPPLSIMHGIEKPCEALNEQIIDSKIIPADMPTRVKTRRTNMTRSKSAAKVNAPEKSTLKRMRKAEERELIPDDPKKRKQFVVRKLELCRVCNKIHYKHGRKTYCMDSKFNLDRWKCKGCKHQYANRSGLRKHKCKECEACGEKFHLNGDLAEHKKKSPQCKRKGKGKKKKAPKSSPDPTDGIVAPKLPPQLWADVLPTVAGPSRERVRSPSPAPAIKMNKKSKAGKTIRKETKKTEERAKSPIPD